MSLSALPKDLQEQLSNPETQGFDYASLDSETRIVVQQRTNEIKRLMRQTATDIIDTGQKLTEVKEKLGHGKFGDWLKAEFEWDERTARRFMSVAHIFNSDNLSELSFAPSALYILAAPSTPSQVRQEALERAAQGETITHSKALAIATRYKEATKLRTTEPVTFDDAPAKTVKGESSSAIALNKLATTVETEPVKDVTESFEEASAELPGKAKPEPPQWDEDEFEAGERNPASSSDSPETLDELVCDRGQSIPLGALDSPETSKVDSEDGAPNELVLLHLPETNEQPTTLISSASEKISQTEPALGAKTELSPQDLVPEPASKDKQLFPSIKKNSDIPPDSEPPTPATLVNRAAITQGVPEAVMTELAIAIQNLTPEQLARLIRAAANGLSDSQLEAVIEAAFQVFNSRHQLIA